MLSNMSLLRAPFLLLFFVFTPFVFSQYYIDLDEKILQTLETENTYTEGDGKTIWEKMPDGTIVKYHFGLKKVHRVYTTNGIKKVFSQSGELLLESSNESEKVFEDGKISNIVEGGVLKTYDKKGKLVSTESGDETFIGINATGKSGFDYETETKSGKVYVSIVEDSVEALRVEKGGTSYDYIKSSNTYRLTKGSEVVWESVNGKRSVGSIVSSIKVIFGRVFGSIPSKGDIEEIIDFVETSLK